jgi:hypothetical protein
MRGLSLPERDPLSLQVAGLPTWILKNYTFEQIEGLLDNKQQFKIAFGGEFSYTEVWGEKCFLDFSALASFFEMATYPPDSPRIYDKVYLYMEAKRRADRKAEKYFSSLLTRQGKQYVSLSL